MNSLNLYWLFQFAGDFKDIIEQSIRELTTTMNPQQVESPSIHEPSPANVPVPKP